MALDGFQRLIWWLFQSSAGGPTRLRLVQAIHADPRNAQQLATALGLDYTTVRHHLKVLQQNHLLDAAGDRYGQVYFIGTNLENRWAMIETIEEKNRQRKERNE